MIVVDVNLLLYAYDASSEFHEKCKMWWENCLSSPETVGLPWATLLAFLRISTSSRILQSPLSIREAIEIVDEWLEQPMVQIIDPPAQHWSTLASLLTQSQSRGPLVPDAHLAAMAIDHGATLCSADQDYARFEKLNWRSPLR